MDASGPQVYDTGPMVVMSPLSPGATSPAPAPASAHAYPPMGPDSYNVFSQSSSSSPPPPQLPGAGEPQAHDAFKAYPHSQPPQNAGYDNFKAFPHSPGPVGQGYVQTRSIPGSPVTSGPMTGEKRPRKQDDRIWGMRLTTFVLSALLVLVVIIAAIAGGVGGALAVENAKEEARESASAAIRAAQESAGLIVTETVSVTASTVTTTVTRTTTTTTGGSPTATSSDDDFVVVPTEGMLPLDCPRMNGTTHTLSLGARRYSFDAECGTDIRGSGVTLLAIAAYSFDDCMRACASYNEYGRDTSRECVSVAFTQDLGVLASNYGTCWLKNSEGTLFEFEEERADTRIVARLVNVRSS